MILAIIDHMENQLFIEKVDEDIIIEKYNGNEEDYIKDKYGYDDKSLFSWDYLTKPIEVFGTDKLTINYNKKADKMAENVTKNDNVAEK